MNKREPTMEDALRKLDQEIQETVVSHTTYAPPHIREMDRAPDGCISPGEQETNGKRRRKPTPEPVKEPTDKNTWLKSMAEALLDARYEEMMILAEGIKADPKVIHQWAKTYVGDT